MHQRSEGTRGDRGVYPEPREAHKPTNPVHMHNGSWYYWDEVWAYRYGPFTTREEAVADLNLYMKQLEGMDDDGNR